MSLRWRIIAFAIAISVLPVVALGLGLRNYTIEQAHSEYDGQLASSVDTAQRRVSERRERERRAVERLCNDDIVVDRLLLDLQAGRFGPAEHDNLVARLPGVMRSMDLAALSLLDGQAGAQYGRVLASGHFAGRAGADDSALARAVETQGEGWFVERMRVRDHGQTGEVLAVLTGCVVERGGARVIAVGGQLLDASFVHALAADAPPLRIALTDASGALPEGISDSGGRRDIFTFAGLDGQPAARLVAAIDDGPLQARVSALERLLIWTIGAALLAAILLGLLLGVAITRPLRERGSGRACRAWRYAIDDHRSLGRGSRSRAASVQSHDREAATLRRA